jgi:O-succinylbenzoic acid--CoA ligase
VQLDAGGITPLGRLDSLVKVLGELVDPEQIAREILALSGGKISPQALTVVAIPDQRGEHAFVPVFDASVDRALMNQILASYHESAPGLRRLRDAIVLDHLPLSPLGKPLRAEIIRVICGQA